MHEYSIVQALLDRVDGEARARGATAVHALSIRIGELSGVEVDLLATAYEMFRAHTICESAALEIQAVPAQWACGPCGAPIRRGAILRCPHCDAPATLVQGAEIMLDRIEMEVP